MERVPSASLAPGSNKLGESTCRFSLPTSKYFLLALSILEYLLCSPNHMRKTLIWKAWDINSSFHSLWQEPGFYYKYRLQKEPIRRRIISQESVTSLVWRAASRAKLHRKLGAGWWGGGSDGFRIRWTGKKKGKEKSEWETIWKSKDMGKWKENIRRK